MSLKNKEVKIMANGFTLNEVLVPETSLEQVKDYEYVFIFSNDKILCQNIKSSSEIPIFVQQPKKMEPSAIEYFISNINTIKDLKSLYFAKIEGKKCLLIYFPTNKDRKIEIDGYHFSSLRNFYRQGANPWIMLGGFSYQIYKWDESHSYCGKCGNSYEYAKEEFSKKCSRCNNILYPQIAPAVIVAIIKDNKILLAHNERFPKNLYSVIAGFVSVGENLEETLVREVKEEVGINIKKIRYISSQPWPFPNSLMLGFMAEWDSGEIVCDGIEIHEAKWFGLDDLNEIILPSNISISRQLIEIFRKEQNVQIK
jgi:NAD+ diphosphatase